MNAFGTGAGAGVGNVAVGGGAGRRRGVLWRYIFQSNDGLANALLYQFGFIQHYVVWLDKPTLALTIAAVATAWKGLPFLTLIILAALQSIPEALFRAARMDGAGLWRAFALSRCPTCATS